MTKPLGDAKTAEQALTELFMTLLVLGSAIATFLAWFLPQTKSGAVLRRFNYPQFLTAVLLTLFLASVLMTVLRPHSKRRTVAFRIAAVWIGGIAARRNTPDRTAGGNTSAAGRPPSAVEFPTNVARF